MSNSPTHRTDRILDSDQTNDIHTWIASHRFIETILRDTQDELKQAQTEITGLQEHVEKLEQWNNLPIMEWAAQQEDYEILVHAVIQECENLRKGVGVSYAYNADPLRKLKNQTPSVESILAIRACREQVQANLNKLKETNP